MAVIEEDIEKYFHFLVETFGFQKMPEYSFATEVHNDYWKKNLDWIHVWRNTSYQYFKGEII